MINRIIFFSIAFFGLLSQSYKTKAQNADIFAQCTAFEMLQSTLSADSLTAKKVQQIENYLVNSASKNEQQKDADQVIIIPVVVHILYYAYPQIVTDQQVTDQISILNRDFRKENTVSDALSALAADTKIQFQLAHEDPNGNSTTGIVRKNTNKPIFNVNFSKSLSQSPNIDMKVEALGGSDAWPKDKYLNVWIIDMQDYYRGFATFPNSVADIYDGVVINYQYFGSIGSGAKNANYNGGRTLVHETGHWLSLRHIWGDGGCEADDGVDDTPPQDGYNAGCPGYKSTCGYHDMFQNYMDYTNDACMQLFTYGQKDRMRAVFENGGPKANFQHQLQLGIIGDRVWKDENFDGMQQSGEPGVANIKVELYSENYNKITESYTDAQGNYLITDIEEGNYFLKFLSEGQTFTLPSSGTNGAMDSDVDHANGLNTTSMFPLRAGEYVSDVDAGLVEEIALAIEEIFLEVDEYADRNEFEISWIADINILDLVLEKKAEGEANFMPIHQNENFLEPIGNRLFKEDLPLKNSYYRARITDIEGNTTNSNIIYLKAKAKLQNSIVQIYPNPTTDRLNINVEDDINQLEILLTNASGQVVISKHWQEDDSVEKNDIQLDISNLSSGLYFVRIKNNNKYYNKRIFVND